jgi:hypothetical protein
VRAKDRAQHNRRLQGPRCCAARGRPIRLFPPRFQKNAEKVRSSGTCSRARSFSGGRCAILCMSRRDTRGRCSSRSPSPARVAQPPPYPGARGGGLRRSAGLRFRPGWRLGTHLWLVARGMRQRLRDRKLRSRVAIDSAKGCSGSNNERPGPPRSRDPVTNASSRACRAPRDGTASQPRMSPTVGEPCAALLLRASSSIPR